MRTTFDTIEITAERLHMSRTKLYALVKAGRVPAHRAPGGKRSAYLFVPEEVDAAILGKTPVKQDIPAAADPSDLSQV